IVTSEQLALWEWIAGYYLCQLGEVMQAALPSALKLASETKIIAVDLDSVDRSSLNDKEYLILDALDISPEIKVSDIVKLLGQKTVLPILKGLFDKGVIRISEEVSSRYKPRTKVFVQLNPLYEDADARKELFDTLNRAPKQLDAVMTYIHLKRGQDKISRSELLERSACGTSALKTLITKEVFSIE